MKLGSHLCMAMQSLTLEGQAPKTIFAPLSPWFENRQMCPRGQKKTYVFCLRLLILAVPLGYGPFAQRKNQCCVGLDVAGALGVVGVWGLVGLFMDSS